MASNSIACILTSNNKLIIPRRPPAKVFIPAYLGKKEMHGGCIGMIIPVGVHDDSPLIMARIRKAMTGENHGWSPPGNWFTRRRFDWFSHQVNLQCSIHNRSLYFIQFYFIFSPRSPRLRVRFLDWFSDTAGRSRLPSTRKLVHAETRWGDRKGIRVPRLSPTHPNTLFA